MITYGFTKTIESPFEEVLEKTKNELVKEDFGVLTSIDLREKFKEKLGIDFKRYVILGACNPPSAHKALLSEENIGLMLPCNVIVYEKNGQTVGSTIKPTVAMQMIENKDLEDIAKHIEGKMKRVFEAV